LAACSLFASSSSEPTQPGAISSEDGKEAQTDADLNFPETSKSGASIATLGTFNSASQAEGSSLEILWQVPTEPVEAFRLSYGFSPENLEKEVRIPIASLQKLDDPAFGPVFSYQLSGITADQVVYVSLRAENQGLISPPSPTLKVTKGQTSSTTPSATPSTAPKKGLKK
jgi:hypothetical protein